MSVQSIISDMNTPLLAGIDEYVLSVTDSEGWPIVHITMPTAQANIQYGKGPAILATRIVALDQYNGEVQASIEVQTPFPPDEPHSTTEKNTWILLAPRVLLDYAQQRKLESGTTVRYSAYMATPRGIVIFHVYATLKIERYHEGDQVNADVIKVVHVAVEPHVSGPWKKKPRIG